MTPHATAPRLLTAIDRGVGFLAERQLPGGEFRTESRAQWLSPECQVVGDWEFDSSPFVTSLVLQSLAYARDTHPLVGRIISRGLAFLVQQMEPGGLWRYWSRNHPRYYWLPPDLDDTACASYVLRANGIRIPDNRGYFHDSRDPGGAFYTWLHRADSFRKRILWLRTGGRSFVYNRKFLWGLAKDDVCSVVNANTVLYLGQSSQTERAIEFLNSTIAEGREDQSRIFYASRLSLYYAVSRAYRHGVAGLRTAGAAIVDRTLALRRADGSFRDEMETALAICTLLNYGCDASECGDAARFLLEAQRSDGSWPRIGVWGGQAMPDCFGSAELTTGFCLEALARCAAIP